jgi:thymidylate synthase
MQNFHDLMANTLENGIDQFNTRTGRICRALVGEQLQFDLSSGFPAVTSKKLAFKGVKGELLGFFRGYDNAADFRALGCNIWDKNANEDGVDINGNVVPNKWLTNPYRKGTDDLGRVYGVQWTAWSDKRIVHMNDVWKMEKQGYKLLGSLMNTTHPLDSQVLMERKINQLEKVLTQLLTDPSDRRMIVSAWNPAELDMMALPPCHMDYRFVAFENPRVLHVVMTIRSWDEFLGAPFNIASTALFLEIMSRLAGFKAGTVTIQATNAHLYDFHFDQVKEQLSRDHFANPTIVLSDNIKQITSLDDVKGAFERIEPNDIWLDGYESHEAISAPMAT